jgi:hypothetical protein
MAVVFSGNRRAATPRRSGAVRPSIREVCLMGIAAERHAREMAEAWVSGEPVTWSGRSYRVEQAQVRPVGDGGGGGEPACYVHLSARAEG